LTHLHQLPSFKTSRGNKPRPCKGEEQQDAATEQGPIGKEQFRWEEGQQTYRCPQGHLLQLECTKKEERGEAEQVQVQIYRCPAEHCRECPLRQRCTKSPTKGRTVQRMRGQELLDELAARMKTEQGKQEYKKRKQTVELRYADLKEHRGVVRVRGYGLAQAWGVTGLSVLVSNGLTLLRQRERKKAKGRAEAQSKAQTADPTPGHQAEQRREAEAGQAGATRAGGAGGQDKTAQQAQGQAAPTGRTEQTSRPPGTTRPQSAPQPRYPAEEDWFGWN
jgi:hypothetical protein